MLFLKPARSLLILTLLVVVSLFAGVVISARASNFQLHAPILIDGNGGFTATNGITGGNGTVSDPYIIEGWEVASAPGPALRIQGTSAHFVIRNIYLHSSPPLSGFVGVVELEGVANGRIENATISNNSRHAGVHVTYSTNITISHSRIESNEGDAIGVESPRNVTITNNLVRSNLEGIFVTGVGTSYSEIVGNDVSSSTDFGIYVTSSTDVISGNLVYNNGVGIAAIRRCNCPITDNTVSNNRLGIEVNNGPIVFHNNLINNTVQAESGCPYGPCIEPWDNGYPSGGNYWSDNPTIDNCSGPNQDKCPDPDGIIDQPRIMNRGIDRYPLVKPFAPIVSGMVRFEPSSITLQSNGRYLTAFVGLPEGYKTSNLIPSSIRLNGTMMVASGAPVSHPNGIDVLVVRFNMNQVRTLFRQPGNYVLLVSGNLLTNTNFRPFEAIATVQLHL